MQDIDNMMQKKINQPAPDIVWRDRQSQDETAAMQHLMELEELHKQITEIREMFEDRLMKYVNAGRPQGASPILNKENKCKSHYFTTTDESLVKCRAEINQLFNLYHSLDC